MDVVGWSPAPLDDGVPTNTLITIGFSDFPDPDSISVKSMLVTSSVFRVPESYRVDLMTRSVIMTPNFDLTANLGYSINVLEGVQSLAGCSGQSAHAEFTTGGGPIDRPAPVTPTFADIGPILGGACAGNCHAATDGSCLASPAAGLSLCLPEARNALLDVPSREIATLALVTPLSAARSYLMRKLVPATPDGAPIPGVLGQREPPGPPLPPEQLRAIADWIDGGALP
jgi:hypothetical protein